MVEQASREDLPSVLIVGTQATASSRNRLIDALKLKQKDALDLDAGVWTLVTNYYTAKVKLTSIELDDAMANISNIFESQQVQSVIYFIEDPSVSF